DRQVVDARQGLRDSLGDEVGIVANDEHGRDGRGHAAMLPPADQGRMFTHRDAAPLRHRRLWDVESEVEEHLLVAPSRMCRGGSFSGELVGSNAGLPQAIAVAVDLKAPGTG